MALLMDTPYITWKKNKWRSDLRKYTRDFQKAFYKKQCCTTVVLNVYTSRYLIDQSINTDKYHITPVFISFGMFKKDDKFFIRGLNLLYLTTTEMIQVLEDVSKFYFRKKETRYDIAKSLYEKWMNIVPFAFKDFDEKRLINITEVPFEELGMIPLLHRHIFGNFNVESLKNDIKIENKTRVTKKKKISENTSNNLDYLDELDEEEVEDMILENPFDDVVYLDDDSDI